MEVLFFAKVVKDGLLGKAMRVQANRYLKEIMFQAKEVSDAKAPR